jgi:ubiquitin-conjugating enzyme E2 Q
MEISHSSLLHALEPRFISPCSRLVRPIFFFPVLPQRTSCEYHAGRASSKLYPNLLPHESCVFYLCFPLTDSDVSGYPSENTFMIFTQSPDVSNGVNEVLEEAASASTGMQIPKLIADIAQQLQRTLATGSSSDPLDIDDSADDKIANFDGQDSDADDDLEFDDEDGLYDIDDQSDDDMGVFKPVNSVGQTTAARVLSIDAAAKLNKRIRADLRAVRFAGFKLGILRGLKADSQMCLLSISIQVSKLGLSDEVLQAWDLKPEQHIVLLIRYASGYKTFEEVISQPSKSLDISFRIGVCQKYKPPALDAVSAFAEIEKTTNWQETHENEATRFGGLFISSSLNEFLNDMFISLVKIRKHASVGWDGAKLFFKTQQGRPYDANFHFTPEYFQEEPPAQTSLPDMMKHDHLTDAGSTPVSFSLVAAQFALRYVLRCTEFCLVCHDRLPGDFEALKPYVCSNPLCLYQYMSLGFGPSLEHEILTQPFVVDLLVSLCYVAAHVSDIFVILRRWILVPTRELTFLNRVRKFANTRLACASWSLLLFHTLS